MGCSFERNLLISPSDGMGLIYQSSSKNPVPSQNDAKQNRTVLLLFSSPSMNLRVPFVSEGPLSFPQEAWGHSRHRSPGWSPRACGGRGACSVGLTQGCCRASLRSGLRRHRSWSSGTRVTSGPSLRECSLVSCPPWYTCPPYTTGKGRVRGVRKAPTASGAKSPASPAAVLPEHACFLRSHSTRRTRKSSSKTFLQESWVLESENFRKYREVHGAWLRPVQKCYSKCDWETAGQDVNPHVPSFTEQVWLWKKCVSLGSVTQLFSNVTDLLSGASPLSCCRT